MRLASNKYAKKSAAHGIRRLLGTGPDARENTVRKRDIPSRIRRCGITRETKLHIVVAQRPVLHKIEGTLVGATPLGRALFEPMRVDHRALATPSSDEAGVVARENVELR